MHPRTPAPGFLRRTFRPTWTDLAPLVRDNDHSLSHQEAKLWSLVLVSRHIPHRMRRCSATGGDYTVQVQAWFAQRAADEIRLYIAENAPDGKNMIIHDLRPVSGYEPTLFAMTLLILFHWVASRTYPGHGLHPHQWLDMGSVKGAAILSGEWWRVATGLTLHADGPHVAGNAIIGGVFIWLASRRLGSGLAWLLTVQAGILGNTINIMVLGAHHNAIGFSTATFGAAGILAAIAPFGIAGGTHGFGNGPPLLRIWNFIRSALVPVAAGLGLLAMLGAGEETDLGAHLFGFLSGLGLGGIAGFMTTRLGLPGKWTDVCLYATALAIPAACWATAWMT